MTKRDEHLWEEEVVEAFLDLDRSGRDYAELEISPANVVCDVRMVHAVPRTRSTTSPGTWRGWRRASSPSRMARAGRSAGPRSRACPGRASAPSPPRRDIALPPRPGDRWRFNVFRVERPGGKEHPEKGAIEVGVVRPALAELPRAGVVPRPRLRRAVTTGA